MRLLQSHSVDDDGVEFCIARRSLMRCQRVPSRQALIHHQNQSYKTHKAYQSINPIRPIGPITRDLSHQSHPSYRSQKQKIGTLHCMMSALIFFSRPDGTDVTDSFVIGPIGAMGLIMMGLIGLVQD